MSHMQKAFTEERTILRSTLLSHNSMSFAYNQLPNQTCIQRYDFGHDSLQMAQCNQGIFKKVDMAESPLIAVFSQLEPSDNMEVWADDKVQVVRKPKSIVKQVIANDSQTTLILIKQRTHFGIIMINEQKTKILKLERCGIHCFIIYSKITGSSLDLKIGGWQEGTYKLTEITLSEHIGEDSTHVTRQLQSLNSNCTSAVTAFPDVFTFGQEYIYKRFDTDQDIEQRKRPTIVVYSAQSFSLYSRLVLSDLQNFNFSGCKVDPSCDQQFTSFEEFPRTDPFLLQGFESVTEDEVFCIKCLFTDQRDSSPSICLTPNNTKILNVSSSYCQNEPHTETELFKPRIELQQPKEPNATFDLRMDLLYQPTDVSTYKGCIPVYEINVLQGNKDIFQYQSIMTAYQTGDFQKILSIWRQYEELGCYKSDLQARDPQCWKVVATVPQEPTTVVFQIAKYDSVSQAPIPVLSQNITVQVFSCEEKVINKTICDCPDPTNCSDPTCNCSGPVVCPDPTNCSDPTCNCTPSSNPNCTSAVTAYPDVFTFGQEYPIIRFDTDQDFEVQKRPPTVVTDASNFTFYSRFIFTDTINFKFSGCRIDYECSEIFKTFSDFPTSDPYLLKGAELVTEEEIFCVKCLFLDKRNFQPSVCLTPKNKQLNVSSSYCQNEPYTETELFQPLIEIQQPKDPNITQQFRMDLLFRPKDPVTYKGCVPVYEINVIEGNKDLFQYTSLLKAFYSGDQEQILSIWRQYEEWGCYKPDIKARDPQCWKVVATVPKEPLVFNIAKYDAISQGIVPVLSQNVTVKVYTCEEKVIDPSLCICPDPTNCSDPTCNCTLPVICPVPGNCSDPTCNCTFPVLPVICPVPGNCSDPTCNCTPVVCPNPLNCSDPTCNCTKILEKVNFNPIYVNMPSNFTIPARYQEWIDSNKSLSLSQSIQMPRIEDLENDETYLTVKGLNQFIDIKSSKEIIFKLSDYYKKLRNVTMDVTETVQFILSDGKSPQTSNYRVKMVIKIDKKNETVEEKNETTEEQPQEQAQEQPQVQTQPSPSQQQQQLQPSRNQLTPEEQAALEARLQSLRKKQEEEKIRIEKQKVKPPQVYEEPVEKFTRDEPGLTKTYVDKKANAKLAFSKKMAFPERWKELLKLERRVLTMEERDEQVIARRNLLRRQLQSEPGANDRMIQVEIENAVDGTRKTIPVTLQGLTDNSVEIKLNFEDPQFVSMSSQNEKDKIYFKFPEDLVLTDTDGNPLTLDKASKSDESASLDVGLTIQPQVVEDSKEQEQLDTASTTMQTTSFMISFFQFLMSYLIGTSLAQFWGLINSQQNLAYVPTLSVNNPAHVSYYLEFLVEVASFDPIPIEIFYDAINLWDFEWVDLEPNVESLANIGIEDRNFILALGSMTIYLFGFVVSLFFMYVLAPCSNRHSFITRVHNFFKIEGYARIQFIRFVLEAYIDLFLAGLINTENAYLFEVSSNWGFNGNISLSDQFSVLLGYFFFIICCLFPFFSVYIFWLKQNSHNMLTRHQEKHMDEMYDVLYDGFKTKHHWNMHYYQVFIYRRLIFICMIYFYPGEEYTVAQIYVNILLSWLFAAYLFTYRPFTDEFINNLEGVNELAFTVIAYHQIGFTDVNPYVETKFEIGWSMVMVSIANIIFPNLYLVVRTMWQDYKQQRADDKAQKRREKLQESDFFEKQRLLLIKRYDLKLKEKFRKDEEEDDHPHDHESQSNCSGSEDLDGCHDDIQCHAIEQLKLQRQMSSNQNNSQVKSFMRRLSKKLKGPSIAELLSTEKDNWVSNHLKKTWQKKELKHIYQKHLTVEEILKWSDPLPTIEYDSAESEEEKDMGFISTAHDTLGNAYPVVRKYYPLPKYEVVQRSPPRMKRANLERYTSNTRRGLLSHESVDSYSSSFDDYYSGDDEARAPEPIYNNFM